MESILIWVGIAVVTASILGIIIRQAFMQIEKDLEWLDYNNLWCPLDSSKKKDRN
ncbi:hypothetical protein N9V27_01240 [bacterium]|nr:hypothetical protein [bacterium]